MPETSPAAIAAATVSSSGTDSIVNSPAFRLLVARTVALALQSANIFGIVRSETDALGRQLKIELTESVNNAVAVAVAGLQPGTTPVQTPDIPTLVNSAVDTAMQGVQTSLETSLQTSFTDLEQSLTTTLNANIADGVTAAVPGALDAQLVASPDTAFKTQLLSIVNDAVNAALDARTAGIVSQVRDTVQDSINTALESAVQIVLSTQDGGGVGDGGVVIGDGLGNFGDDNVTIGDGTGNPGVGDSGNDVLEPDAVLLSGTDLVSAATDLLNTLDPSSASFAGLDESLQAYLVNNSLQNEEALRDAYSATVAALSVT